MTRFETIMNARAVNHRWSNKDQVIFHYLNPNGLYQQKRQADLKIDQLVDQGRAMPGAILAYGGLQDYYSARLRELHAKGRVNSIKLAVVLDGLQREIDTANNFIAEKSPTDET